jgi:hypothetical protein
MRAWLVVLVLVISGGAALRDPLQPITPGGHLMHRAMPEIDIQGHQQFAPRRDCPAVYDAPNGNLRECL